VQTWVWFFLTGNMNIYKFGFDGVATVNIGLDGTDHVIGAGWNIYTQLFPMGDHGVFYCITPDGQLRWYRHDGWYEGTDSWTAGDGGRLVGTGWHIFTTAFAMPGSDGKRPAPSPLELALGKPHHHL
jgi:hypothetical protein